MMKLDQAGQLENAESDVLRFDTKAGTLDLLAEKVKSAIVLPLRYFTVFEWNNNKENLVSQIAGLKWFDKKLIVRSSAIGEDSKENSCAGKYASVIGVEGKEGFLSAVDEVISSFDNNNFNNQILVQPFLYDVKISGVAFSRDPNTDGPYIVINYNAASDDTAAITSGQSNHESYVIHKSNRQDADLRFVKICELITELEGLFGTDYLDVEFAIDGSDKLYLFQARPLVRQKNADVTMQAHQKAVARIEHRVALGMDAHPYLFGSRTVYGVMPDWNPAEIIGVRPKPLALSLYKELITDAVWAYQRDNYGYANLRSFPLLVDFEGLPYIDVRVSFNSFLPKQLPAELSERLVNYYLQRLIAAPVLHDKVEFDIIFSCYVLDLQKRMDVLDAYGFTQEDKDILASSLIKLTNQIVHNQQGLWRKDLEKVEKLKKRQETLFVSKLDPIDKMYWILEDCKRYGTLPFAGLARAGFIAVQILKSFVHVGIINEGEYTNFLSSVNSISTTMQDDFSELSKEEFLKKYGHLRPGTYDILSPRYDEAPEMYFDWNKADAADESNSQASFSLSITQLRMIQEYIDRDKLDVTVLELLEFIKIGIESREYSKFVFTKSVSEFMRILAAYAESFSISREDCAYINIKDIIMLYSSSVDPEDILRKSIELGKHNHQFTSAITLPPLITSPADVWNFAIPDSVPNYITQKNITSEVRFADTEKYSLKNAIIFIPSADPGYDWIFSHDIGGLVTKYGGINSHMAIRAGELGIPAIIGAGEIKYNEWSRCRKLHIDCLNRQVKTL